MSSADRWSLGAVRLAAGTVADHIARARELLDGVELPELSPNDPGVPELLSGAVAILLHIQDDIAHHLDHPDADPLPDLDPSPDRSPPRPGPKEWEDPASAALDALEDRLTTLDGTLDRISDKLRAL